MQLAEAIATLEAHNAFGRGVPLVPGTNVALLGKPEKMPSYSFSLPAGNPRGGQVNGTCPGARYGEGTICGMCYAQKGRYIMPNVAAALDARAKWTLDCLITKEGGDEWVTVMTAAVTWATRTSISEAYDAWRNEICHADYALAPRKPVASSKRRGFFRWHDSGDVFNPKYGELIRRVCANLPDVRFWLPTRSWHATPRILTVLQTVAALPNVAVRPSALRVEEDAPVVPGLSAGTGAKREGFNCPASHQGNQCGSCRKCWVARSTPVHYHLH